MRKLKPHDRVGDYELERRLGIGGMAEVWLAHPLVTGHRAARVVIKLVHDHLANDPKIRTLFVDELALLERIDHPNVVRLYEGGEAEDRLYMAMEYIDGLDLQSCLKAHDGPLWPAFAAAVVAQACIGLQYAHELKDGARPLNLVHRDISPDNVMIDRDGVVKLVDFGIARAETTQATTLSGIRKGKLRYMAPEYLVDGSQSSLIDVYALGVTLWELVTGHKPFQDLAGPALMTAVIKQQLPRAHTIRPSVPRQLVEVIARATAPHASRLASARALELELREFLTAFPAPSQRELGDEVSVWKRRLAGVAARRDRLGGGYGQLESTEMVAVQTDPAIEPPPPGGPAKVLLADALDPTGFVAPPPLGGDAEPAATDPMARPITANVVLSADLEAGATRTGKPPRTRRRR